jgi:hypothetical protein
MADPLRTIDAARHSITRDATFEVQILADTLRTHVEQNCDDANVATAVRGILTRISDLSNIIYEAAVCDETERQDVTSLCKKLGVTRPVL